MRFISCQTALKDKKEGKQLRRNGLVGVIAAFSGFESFPGAIKSEASRQPF